MSQAKDLPDYKRTKPITYESLRAVNKLEVHYNITQTIAMNLSKTVTPIGGSLLLIKKFTYLITPLPPLKKCHPM